MTKLVREFSAAGPCLILGEYVKQTERFIFYREWQGGNKFSPDISRIGKPKWFPRKRHIEPCPSCRDHEATQYPNGYMD
jgi:hypothetical protein